MKLITSLGVSASDLCHRSSYGCKFTETRKLNYQSFLPGNRKQSVSLALSIFNETTIAASRCYYSNRPDRSAFLQFVYSWWLISNSKNWFHPNPLGNDVVVDGYRLKFFFSEFADWFEQRKNGL